MKHFLFTSLLAGVFLFAGLWVLGQELSSDQLRDLDFPPAVFEKPVRPEIIDSAIWARALEQELADEWQAAAGSWSEIARQAESASLYLRSAACYLRIGSPSDAVRELNRSVAISPLRSSKEEHLRALAYWESGDFRQAWKTLMTLTRSKEEEGMHHYHLLTRVALSQNDRAEAIGWARKVAEKGSQAEREAFFNNPAFTILERSRLYALMKKDALDPSRKDSTSTRFNEKEVLELWKISLSLTNHTFSVTNNTMQLAVEWLK